MSESKHTPGPWSWHGDELLSATEFVMATRKGSRPSDNDSRLIAAAPDLLQMLKVAQLWLDVDGRYDMQGINAAIRKAEGNE